MESLQFPFLGLRRFRGCLSRGVPLEMVDWKDSMDVVLQDRCKSFISYDVISFHFVRSFVDAFISLKDYLADCSDIWHGHEIIYKVSM